MCANPRSFSQLTTSFFASESLGIRHTPLTISFLFFYSALESARFSLCDVFIVNVNDTSSLNLVFFLKFILNYKKNKLNVENKGVEPLTSCVQGRRSSQLS